MLASFFFSSILNKLTEETFDRLSDKLLAAGIVDVVVLTGIIKLIFEKALVEPKFSKMYANLCVKIAAHAPNFEGPDGKPLVRICSGSGL